MFSQELRHETEQIVRVGVFLTKQVKLTDSLDPVSGAQLSWYYWRYIVKADGTVVDILSHTWSDIPSCAGLYYLTLLLTDTDKLGSLILYVYDATSLGKPILINFEVIKKNVYDARYGSALLKVESEPQGE